MQLRCTRINTRAQHQSRDGAVVRPPVLYCWRNENNWNYRKGWRGGERRTKERDKERASERKSFDMEIDGRRRDEAAARRSAYLIRVKTFHWIETSPHPALLILLFCHYRLLARRRERGWDSRSIVLKLLSGWRVPLIYRNSLAEVVSLFSSLLFFSRVWRDLTYKWHLDQQQEQRYYVCLV